MDFFFYFHTDFDYFDLCDSFTVLPITILSTEWLLAHWSHHTDTDVMDIEQDTKSIEPLPGQIRHAVKPPTAPVNTTIQPLSELRYTRPPKSDKQAVYQICIHCVFF